MPTEKITLMIYTEQSSLELQCETVSEVTSQRSVTIEILNEIMEATNRIEPERNCSFENKSFNIQTTV